MHAQPTQPGIRVSLAELIEMRHRVREVQLFSTPARRSPLIGLHHSKLRGRGVDFDQVRVYQPGDDVRTIDWRVTARTQEPHTKLFHEERERPIFIMVGAWLFLHEAMRWERWLAVVVGFVGVLIVLAPKLSGGAGGVYHLVMLASAPVFAISFLITKALTRHESPQVIVLWQAISVTLFSLPMALWTWQSPSAWQWAGFALSGLLGSAGHYCLTRSYTLADISSSFTGGANQLYAAAESHANWSRPLWLNGFTGGVAAITNPKAAPNDARMQVLALKIVAPSSGKVLKFAEWDVASW